MRFLPIDGFIHGLHMRFLSVGGFYSWSPHAVLTSWWILFMVSTCGSYQLVDFIHGLHMRFLPIDGFIHGLHMRFLPVGGFYSWSPHVVLTNWWILFIVSTCGSYQLMYFIHGLHMRFLPIGGFYSWSPHAVLTNWWILFMVFTSGLTNWWILFMVSTCMRFLPIGGFYSWSPHAVLTKLVDFSMVPLSYLIPEISGFSAWCPPLSFLPGRDSWIFYMISSLLLCRYILYQVVDFVHGVLHRKGYAYRMPGNVIVVGDQRRNEAMRVGPGCKRSLPFPCILGTYCACPNCMVFDIIFILC